MPRLKNDWERAKLPTPTSTVDHQKDEYEPRQRQRLTHNQRAPTMFMQSVALIAFGSPPKNLSTKWSTLPRDMSWSPNLSLVVSQSTQALFLFQSCKNLSIYSPHQHTLQEPESKIWQITNDISTEDPRRPDLPCKSSYRAFQYIMYM